MKELSFLYRFAIHFSAPVWEHRFTLKCLPESTDRQVIKDLKYELIPVTDHTLSKDAFGNKTIIGICHDCHDLFQVQVEGIAVTGCSSYEAAGEEYLYGRFRYQTKLTEPGEGIRAFFISLSLKEEMGHFEKSCKIMNAVHAYFTYKQRVTNHTTTAEEAFVLREGVCQDYTHVMLSLCRMAGIPCRYVVGLMVGEGESHAWVEIYEDHKWYALDPTNCLVVEDEHIRISIGRDYDDCVINHGIMYGISDQKQEIRVRVCEHTEQ